MNNRVMDVVMEGLQRVKFENFHKQLCITTRLTMRTLTLRECVRTTIITLSA